MKWESQVLTNKNPINPKIPITVLQILNRGYVRIYKDLGIKLRNPIIPHPKKYPFPPPSPPPIGHFIKFEWSWSQNISSQIYVILIYSG